MVLESIMNPFKAEKKPWELFFLGIAYSILALMLSLWVFEEQAGMVMVFLSVVAVLPLFYKTMKYEEEKDVTMQGGEMTLLKEHGKALTFMLMLFLGITTAFSAIYLFLPAQKASEIFKPQTQTITSLNQKVTGKAAQITLMSKIFLNNVRVMIFAILFSLLFGAGAIFILVWNASVISAAVGNFIRSNLAELAANSGLLSVGSYFYVTSLSVLRYAIHGIPEILAYFVAALAGGILSIAIINKDFESKKFERVMLDFSDLVLISVIILFVAAALEVFVTPVFFN